MERLIPGLIDWLDESGFHGIRGRVRGGGVGMLDDPAA